MKVYAWLSAAAFAAIAVFAVLFGSLNQDEGWYLYAAQLVGEGKTLYRDFFFTQGPVMPVVYSFFSWMWRAWGIIGGRALSAVFGALSILFAAALAWRIAREGAKAAAAVTVSLVLGSNLYHVYFLSIPKTYSISALALAAGLYLLTFSRERRGTAFAFASGASLALAACTRTSLALVPAAALAFLVLDRRNRGSAALAFALGCAFAGVAAYLPYFVDAKAREGLVAAQLYHAARGGFSPLLVAGSVSRLVRWYLPMWVLFGLAIAIPACRADFRRDWLPLLLVSFASCAILQLCAPFPYDDYQVPVMPLVAVCAAVAVSSLRPPAVLLALGMAWASSFGSPLVEDFFTAGHDRFWVVRKDASDVSLLKDAASRIEALDPGGKTLLTQDLYLAIETRRHVPEGLEMGPFSYWGDAENAPGLDDAGLKRVIEESPCRVAALSGYSFAITAPSCMETPLEKQLAFWEAVRDRYELKCKMPRFGQHSTSLMILARKGPEGAKGAEKWR